MDRPLSEYEKQINAASLQLCQENASLLSNRKKLFELSKQKIDADGYNYKKKTSRSKIFGISAQKASGSENQQAKVMKEIRQRKINELREDIESCKETISLLQKQRSKFVSAEKFIQAADVVEQVKTHRKKMRESEMELAKHEKAESRSKKYHKEKQKKLASGKCQPQRQLTLSNTESSNTESSNTESSNPESSNPESSNTESSNTESSNTESSNTLQGCAECIKLISAAKCILTENVVKLQSVYVEQFLNKGSKYKTDKAVKRLMQLPVVVFPVKEHQRVTLYVTESEGLNCSKVQILIQNLLEMQEKKASDLSKATLSIICDLASSEVDKKLIKYTALISSGISSTQARKLYGISESTKLKTEVSQALAAASEIQEAVNKLSSVKEKCVLESLGIIDEEYSSDESQDESGDEESMSLSLLDLEEKGETEELQDCDGPISKPLEEEQDPPSNELNSNLERVNLTDPDFMDTHCFTSTIK